LKYADSAVAVAVVVLVWLEEGGEKVNDLPYFLQQLIEVFLEDNSSGMGIAESFLSTTYQVGHPLFFSFLFFAKEDVTTKLPERMESVYPFFFFFFFCCYLADCSCRMSLTRPGGCRW